MTRKALVPPRPPPSPLLWRRPPREPRVRLVPKSQAQQPLTPWAEESSRWRQGGLPWLEKRQASQMAEREWEAQATAKAQAKKILRRRRSPSAPTTPTPVEAQGLQVLQEASSVSAPIQAETRAACSPQTPEKDVDMDKDTAKNKDRERESQDSMRSGTSVVSAGSADWGDPPCSPT